MTTTTKQATERPTPAWLNDAPKRMLIGGEWTGSLSGETFETIDPATEQVLAEVAAADSPDVDLAVAAARRAFDESGWATIAPRERERMLTRICDHLEAHIDELAELESLDNGVPLQHNRTLVSNGLAAYRYYAGWPTKITSDTYPSDRSVLSMTLREPLGVCAGIVPWNGPFLLAAWKIAPALACGNTVVLKPAEQTPLTALRLAELLLEADLPTGVFNVVTGMGSTAGAALAAHPGVDKVAFTGSTEVGRLIVQASAGNLKRVTLELGGKSPNLIFADADLEEAATSAAEGFCFMSGQVCTAGTRLLVEEPIREEFLSLLSTKVREWQVGDPFHPDTRLGPLVSSEQRDRVVDFLDVGRKEGAKVRLGGGTLGDVGYYVEPTIFEDVDNQMRIAREEIFGPVASVMAFTDESEAIKVANDTAYGLGAGVWTRDVSRAHRVARAIASGNVWVNTYNATDPMFSFGGYKQSGIGRELGPAGIEHYSQLKNVVVKI